MQLHVKDADKYLQINDATEADLRKEWSALLAQYPGYEIWLCFRNVDIPAAFLAEIGAALEDDCVRMVMNAPPAEQFPSPPIEQITPATIDEFTAHHDARINDMYWTGARLKADLARWGIFCTRADGRLADYTIMSLRHETEAEIFCLEGDEGHFPALLAHAARHAFGVDKTEVLFMADNEAEKDAAVAVGFETAGFYRGYKIEQ